MHRQRVLMSTEAVEVGSPVTGIKVTKRHSEWVSGIKLRSSTTVNTLNHQANSLVYCLVSFYRPGQSAKGMMPHWVTTSFIN